MEGVGLNRQCSKKAPVGILLLLMCLFVSAFAQTTESQTTKCPVGDYLSEKGICCNKCSPGFKLLKECETEGHRSLCVPCGANLYMDKINFAPNCWICRRCREANNEILVSPCQSDQNAVCRCKEGYYKSYINSETYDCRRCAKCGSDERERQMCNSNNNTVCVCKENYYRVDGRCEPCSSCTPECGHHCTRPPLLNTRGPHPESNLLTHVIVGTVSVGLVLFVLVILVTVIVTRRVTERNGSEEASQEPRDSLDSCEQVLIISEKPSHDSTVEAVAYSEGVAEDGGNNLPDCVPLEIKTSDLIYTVLDLVPVLQVKRLVRSLGVTDMEIEQAEVDYRPCREAHYQMLRGWAERGLREGGGGRGGLLHRPLLEELLDKLRKMHLGGAAEDLEAKYDCQ